MASEGRGDRGERFCETHANAIELVKYSDTSAKGPIWTLTGIHVYMENTGKEDIIQRWIEDMNRNKDFENAWSKAQKILEKTSASYPEMRKEHKLAIITYTLGPPHDFYKKINEESRNWTSALQFQQSPYKNFWCLLHGSMKDLCSKYVNACGPTKGQYVYRGCNIPFSTKIEDEIVHKEFVSTSFNQSIAESFAGAASDCTVFYYKASSPGGALSAPLKELTEFPGEEEMILFPYAVFRVENYKKIGNRTEIYLTKATRTWHGLW